MNAERSLLHENHLKFLNVHNFKKMTKKEINIFDSLIGMNLEMVILEVLTMLDSQSLTNARLTCRKWRNVIDNLVWHTETGKKYLYGLNKNNFLHNEPNVVIKQLSERIHELRWDKQDIIIVTAIHGKVMCFDTNTLDLKWEKQPFGHQPDDVDVNITFNDYAIFTLSTHLIIVYRRSDGHCLFKIVLSDPENYQDLQEFIWGIYVWNNRLAISSSPIMDVKCTRITFYDVDFTDQKVLQMSQRVENCKYLDHDENHLISSMRSKELVLWNFQTCQEVKRISTSYHISSGRIKLPYVVIIRVIDRCRPENKNIKDPMHCIKIFNFELGTLIRSVPVGLTLEPSLRIQLTNMWLMIFRHTDQCTPQEDPTVEIFYWPDLIQEAVELGQVPKRSIKVTEIEEASMTGDIDKTRMITAEGEHLVVRKFWP
jgi:hypothetical protein